jgi:Fe-S-cluster containining protein
VLSPEQRSIYRAMVGADGWCIHFDTGRRRCRIYADRPEFCRVEGLAGLFDVPEPHQEAFAIACCRQQIRVEYGGKSSELKRFERALRTPRP